MGASKDEGWDQRAKRVPAQHHAGRKSHCGVAKRGDATFASVEGQWVCSTATNVGLCQAFSATFVVSVYGLRKAAPWL